MITERDSVGGRGRGKEDIQVVEEGEGREVDYLSYFARAYDAYS